jgi:hypothetical protein
MARSNHVSSQPERSGANPKNAKQTLNSTATQGNFDTDQILYLQQVIGNHALQRMLQSGKNDAHANGCQCAACAGIQRYAEHKPLQRAAEQHGKGCSCPSCSEQVQRKADSTSSPLDSHLIATADAGFDKPLLQRALASDLSMDAFLEELDNEDKRKILDHRPSTGLGRFDAEYLPREGKLRIIVKAFLDFGDKGPENAFVSGLGNWTESEKNTFTENFKQQAEDAWSGKFTFRAKKEGFEEIVAKPEVTFVAVDNVDDSHFHHRIDKSQDTVVGIGREQNSYDPDNPEVGSRVNIGNFKQSSQNVGAQKASICNNIAFHDKRRIGNLITAFNLNPLRFRDGTLDDASRDKLGRFAARLVATSRPGSVPVPIHVVGVDDKRERYNPLVGGKALARANTVKTILQPLLAEVRNPVVAKASDKTTSDVSEATKNYQRIATRDGADSRSAKESRAKLDDVTSKVNLRQAIVEVDMDFNWTGDPYSVLAHEFGHMLGNPDEYFEYGSEAIRDAKVRQLQESGNPDELVRATQLQAVRVTANEKRGETQEAFANLAEGAGQTIPEFNSTNSNIMSAGTDLLPVHYTPLLEALSKITASTLPYDQWSIE